MGESASPKKRTLSKAKIISQALALANTDSIDKLSMRKLADALGVTAMSLYNHVGSKDDLIDVMLNEVVSQIGPPAAIDGDWQQTMRQRAISYRQTLLENRWAAPMLISRIVVGDAILNDIDATVGCLVNSGFSYAQADWARNAIDSHIFGYTTQELNYPVAPQDYKHAAEQFLPMIPQRQFPFMHEAALQIIEGKYDGMTQFEFGLDLILDGLHRWQKQTK
ncbi:TetR/AcrR family transcriptional regulator C-terminal domain-containing protein [Maritalea sp.]|uniref:TetR/AcrR family transcriptional regulator C-terminal domain-containing protein n=1 Tax=Maritalea sp. TaxID=2003361 RepID=UPI003EF81895